MRLELTTPSLEGWCSTNRATPALITFTLKRWWRGKDSNLRRHTPADLQSAPFGHSGTTPWSCSQESNLRPSVYKTDALPTELEQPKHPLR